MFPWLDQIAKTNDKPVRQFAWILESHPGNPLLRLSDFREIRANLKLFNHVHIFPPNQSCQPLAKKQKMFQATINDQGK